MLATIALAVACSSKPDVPPAVKGTAPENPRSCADLADAGSVQGSEVLVAGKQATCIADGMLCPFTPDVAATAQCAGAQPIALCQHTRWVVSCTEPDEAGPADAGTDADAGSD